MGSNTYLSFNIDEVKGNDGNDGYKKFIEDLRNLRESAQNSVPPSTLLLHIDLITGEDTITLKIEPENLYVRGYFACTDCWEFSDSSMIPEAKPLPYPLLLGADALHQNSSLKASPLGYVHLRDAISHLANYPPPIHKEEKNKFAKSIVIIIQMISEAAKIELIAEHVAKNWLTPAPIDLDMKAIQTALELGKFSPSMHRILPKYHSKVNFALKLVSIRYVFVKGIEGGNHGDIYGTVMVEDFRSFNHIVYDSKQTSGMDSTEIQGLGKRLLMTGPSKRVFGNDPFFIKVSLSDDEGEIVDESFLIDTVRGGLQVNKLLEVCASGTRGSTVTVGYSIFSRAYLATIVVVMNDDDGKSSQIYGKITASHLLGETESESESSERMLFDISEKNCLHVMSGQPIPLTCPVFPVPKFSKLEIKAKLNNSDGLLIASHIVVFVGVMGAQLENICGPGGGVQVSITCV